VDNTDIPISKAALQADIPLEVFGQLENEITVEIQATPESSEIFWNFPAFDVQRDGEGNVKGKIQVGNLKALVGQVCLDTQAKSECYHQVVRRLQ